MGCDIHCFAEKKENGKWVKVGKVFPNPYHRKGEENRIDEDGYEWNPEFTDSPYKGRNYDLFGILADVRNGRGFAGIKTGEGFNPIAEPKGLPDDLTEEVKKESDQWNGDGHSHSWFTLKELQDYDWKQETINYGCISLEQYKKYKKTGKPPESYCGSVSGGKIRNITTEEMDEMIKNKSFNKNYEYYTTIGWGTSYREAVGEFFFKKTMANLEKIAPPEDIRIVFWFDN